MTRFVSGHADLSLAERCRDGAPGAFDELYRAHAPRLFGLTCRMVGRPDAEDLLQEIFLTAHRKLTQYKGDSSLGTWLFRLGANLCIDHLRSRGARLSQLSDAIDDDFDSPPGASGPVLGVVDAWIWIARWRVCRRDAGRSSCCMTWRGSSIARSAHC
jgi:RNA polymerase sigma factor (sigma-70 family)